jgi:hypothetical protein
MHLTGLEPAIPAKETGIHAPEGTGTRNPSKTRKASMHLTGLEPVIPAKETGIHAPEGIRTRHPSKGDRNPCTWRNWNPQSQQKETGIKASGRIGIQSPSKRRLVSMHLEGLESAIPVRERLQTHSLNRAVTVCAVALNNNNNNNNCASFRFIQEIAAGNENG